MTKDINLLTDLIKLLHKHKITNLDLWNDALYFHDNSEEAVLGLFVFDGVTIKELENNLAERERENIIRH